MNIRINPNDVSFANLKRLKSFENDVCAEIKKYLNTEFPYIKLNINITLTEWKEYPVRGKSILLLTESMKIP